MTTHTGAIDNLVGRLNTELRTNERALNAALVALATDPSNPELGLARDAARAQTVRLRQEIEDLARAREHARDLDTAAAAHSAFQRNENERREILSMAQQRNVLAKELGGLLDRFMELHRAYGQINQQCAGRHYGLVTQLAGSQEAIRMAHVINGSAPLALVDSLASAIQDEIWRNSPQLVEQARFVGDRQADQLDRLLRQAKAELPSEEQDEEEEHVDTH